MKEMLELYLSTQEYPLATAKLLAKPYAMQKFNERVLKCHQCKHCQMCQHEALYGNSNGTLLIVLPSSDITDLEQAYLHKLLEASSINLDIVAYTYAIQGCFKENGNKRPPYKLEAQACSFFMKEALEIIEPLAILCLSTISSNLFYFQALDDKKSAPSFIQNTPIFTTYSPTYLLNLYQNNDLHFEEKQEAFLKTLSECLKYLSKTYPNLSIYKENNE